MFQSIIDPGPGSSPMRLDHAFLPSNESRVVARQSVADRPVTMLKQDIMRVVNQPSNNPSR